MLERESRGRRNDEGSGGEKATRRNNDGDERRGERLKDVDGRGIEKNCSLPSTPAARSHQLPFFLSSRKFNPRMKIARCLSDYAHGETRNIILTVRRCQQ